MSFPARLSVGLKFFSRRQFPKNVKNCLRSGPRSQRFSAGYTGYRLLAFVPVVKAAWGFGKKEEAKAAEVVAELSLEERIIKEADELYAQNEILKLYDLLVANKDIKNDQILWRLARAGCDKGKLSSDKEVKKQLIYEAFDYVKQALELNDNNFASHKWYGILLDYVGGYEGTKQRIKNAYLVKDHFLRAIELNPKDATTVHALGIWCFNFADLSWIQQRAAALIFTTPPSSSYEEALKYFTEAENIDPNFYSMNLMMIGKSYLRLNDRENAVVFLQRARDYPITTADDKEAHKEAVELLKQLGVQ